MSATTKISFDQTIRLRVVRVVVVLAVILVLLSYPAWRDDSVVAEMAELIGIVLLFTCILGRLWSILYSGGKKNSELVTEGPYSVTRNPLYLFSILGAVGIGLMFSSLVMAAVLGGSTALVFYVTARGEAAVLRSKFGGMYDTYAQRVPLFMPNWSLYKEVQNATFSPRVLKKTLRDTLYFLVVLPLVEFIEWLRKDGMMPDLFPMY